VKVAAFTGWTKLTLYLLLFALSARNTALALPQVLGNYTYLHVALIVSVYGLRFFVQKACHLG